MNRGFLIGFGLLALAGCGTTRERTAREPTGSATQVTSFHLGGEIAPGEVAIERKFATQRAGANEPAYENAVATELRRLGFTATPALATTSEFVATVDVATGTGLQLQARSPGAQVIAGTAANPNRIASQLAVQLKRRSDGSLVWDGRAQIPAAAGAVPTPAQVATMARALFRDFPGESGRTISVR